MNSDLDAIVSADEEARARIEAAATSAQARVQAALDERERCRRACCEALRNAVDDEERRIQEAADRAVADRQATRARYREARRRAAESALARAAEVYARIIADGPRGIPSRNAVSSSTSLHSCRPGGSGFQGHPPVIALRSRRTRRR
jgi:hypothetical protein